MVALYNLRLHNCPHYLLSNNNCSTIFNGTLTIYKRSISNYQLKEYYALLNVNRNSTTKEIKDSFLKLSKVYHPDNKNTGSHLKFVKLKEAYDAIKDGPQPSSASSYSSSSNSSYSPPYQKPYSSSSYANYQNYNNLNQDAHNFYRSRERDYQSYGFGGPFANSKDPWEDYKRSREKHRRYQEEQNPFRARPFVNTTIFVSALAWIVIYSSVLLIWDYNDEMKKDSTQYRSGRSYQNYLAYQEMNRKRQTEEFINSRPLLRGFKKVSENEKLIEEYKRSKASGLDRIPDEAERLPEIGTPSTSFSETKLPKLNNTNNRDDDDQVDLNGLEEPLSHLAAEPIMIKTT